MFFVLIIIIDGTNDKSANTIKSADMIKSAYLAKIIIFKANFLSCVNSFDFLWTLILKLNDQFVR